MNSIQVSIAQQFDRRWGRNLQNSLGLFPADSLKTTEQLLRLIDVSFITSKEIV